MNLNHLRFITWDNLLFSSPLDYASLQKILNNENPHPQPTLPQKGLQSHLHQLLTLIDTFFDPDKITDIITLKHTIFSDPELIEIQNKAIELRLLIQCQKIYADEYWINHKRQWVVEVRILASLLRIYNIIVRIWAFFIERSHDPHNKQKPSKIILPLGKLEGFVNEIFGKLQKVEMCYYLNEFPYLVDIHVVFKSWRELLCGFPKVKREEIVMEFSLKWIVLAENQKYKKVYKDRMLLLPESPRKIKRELEQEKQKQKEKELHKMKNNSQLKRANSLNESCLWHNKILISISSKPKPKRHKSLEKVFDVSPPKRLTVRFPFQPIQLLRKSKTSLFLKQRTLSSCTSIRNPSFSKSILPSKLSTTDDFTNNDLSSKFIPSPRETVTRETMSPTRIPKPKARRPEMSGNTEKLVEEKNPTLKVMDFERYGKEKEAVQFTFTKHHEVWIREYKKEGGKGGEMIRVSEEGFEVRRGGKTYEEMEYEIERVLSANGKSINLREKSNFSIKRRLEYQQQI